MRPTIPNSLNKGVKFRGKWKQNKQNGKIAKFRTN